MRLKIALYSSDVQCVISMCQLFPNSDSLLEEPILTKVFLTKNQKSTNGRTSVTLKIKQTNDDD